MDGKGEKLPEYERAGDGGGTTLPLQVELAAAS